MDSAQLARRWQEADGDFARMAEALNGEVSEELPSRADLAATKPELESKIEGLKAELVKWIASMMVLQVVAIVGLVRLLFVL